MNTAQTQRAANGAGPKMSELTAKAAATLRGRDIVCFCQDWTGDPLSKTHLMRLLAHENRVLWVNSIGLRGPTASKSDLQRIFNKLAAASAPMQEPEPNLFVLSPLAIPAYGRPMLRALNRRLLHLQVKRAMNKLGFKRAVNYVFLPSASIIAGTLGEELVIYHCVDEYAAFTGMPSQALLEMEEDLIRRSDLVIVSAERLLQSKIKFNPRTVLVRHGVDFTHFRRALDAETVVPDEIARLPRPILGFFGLIADWVDLELMEEAARHFSHGSMVFLGKTTTDVSRLEALPNVHFLGRKQYQDLPAYCKAFDVALMPFRINELTLNANPLKVREYIAAGLPVISTRIPEVEVLGLCRIADDRDSFIREIELALADPGPSPARSETVRAESWEARLTEIRTHIATLT